MDVRSQFRIATLVAALAALTACGRHAPPVPPEPLRGPLPAPAAPMPWEPYAGDVPATARAGAWRAPTAWGYPPGAHSVTRGPLPAVKVPPSKAVTSASLPATDAGGGGAAAKTAPASTPAQTVGQLRLSGDVAPVPRATLGQERIAHAESRVSESFKESYARALADAAVKGSSRATEEETGNVYAFYRDGSQDGCPKVEVTVMSPGGTLPLLSRWHALKCP